MTASTAAFAEHDHQRCLQQALRKAALLCQERGLRLTEQRRRVLRLVWSSHQPVGAYELLDRLRDEGIRAAPPTVYRALEFLLEHGLIHRLEGLNAYVGCTRPGEAHRAQFLICDRCHRVAEVSADSVSSAISASSARLDFQAARQTVEVHGYCAHCRNECHDHA